MPSWLDDLDVALNETGVDPEAQLRQRQRAMDTSNAVLRQRAQSGMAVNPATTEAVINQVRAETALPSLADAQAISQQDAEVEAARQSGQTGAEIPIIGTSLDALKASGLRMAGGTARLAEDVGMGVRNQEAQAIPGAIEATQAGLASAPIGRNIGGAIPFLAGAIAPPLMALPIASETMGTYGDAREAGVAPLPAAASAGARGLMTGVGMRVMPTTRALGPINPAASVPGAIARQGVAGAADALPATALIEGGSALADAGLADVTGDPALRARSEQGMEALANADLLPELLIANTVGGALGAPMERAAARQGQFRQDVRAARQAEQGLRMQPREGVPVADRVEDLARDVQVPSEREAAQRLQGEQAVAPAEGGDFSILQKAEYDPDAPYRTRLAEQEQARMASAERIAAQEQARVAAEQPSPEQQVEQAIQRRQQAEQRDMDRRVLGPMADDPNFQTLKEVGFTNDQLTGMSPDELRANAEDIWQARGRAMQRQPRQAEPTVEPVAPPAPLQAAESAAPVPPVAEPGTGFRPAAAERRDVPPVAEPAPASRPFDRQPLPQAEAAPASIAADAERLPPEIDRDLEQVRQRFTEATAGRLPARREGSEIVFDVPGGQKGVVRLETDPRRITEVLSHPRNTKAIVASLAAAGRTYGQGARTTAFTNDTAGLQLWNGLSPQAKKNFIGGLIADGQIPAMTVTTPHAEGVPMNLATIIHVLNPGVSAGKLAHEYVAHAAMVGQMPDGMVSRLAAAMQRKGMIQSNNPGAENYVDPAVLRDPKALRNDGTVQEAFGNAYDRFFEAEGARTLAARQKQALAGVEAGRPGVLTPFFDWVRKTFQRLFPFFKRHEKEANDLEAAMREVYKGDVLAEPFDTSRGIGRTSAFEEIRLREKRAEDAKLGREAEASLRQGERELRVRRDAELAPERSGAAERVATIDSTIEALVQQKRTASKDEIRDINQDIAELRAERQAIKSQTKAKEVGAEAEDARVLASPDDRGEQLAVEEPKNRAEIGVTRKGRDIAREEGEAYETPENRDISREAKAILQGFRNQHPGNDRTAYSAFIDSRIDALSRGGGKVKLSQGEVEALRQAAAFLEQEMAKGSPQHRAEFERKYRDAILAYRMAGSEAGRVLASFVDRLQTPAERVSYLRTLLSTPPKKIRTQADALFKSGKSDEAVALLRDTAEAQYVAAKRRLAEDFGIDFDALTEDPSLFDGDLGEQLAVEVAARTAAAIDEPSIYAILKSAYQSNLLTGTGQVIANNASNALVAGMKLADSAVLSPKETAHLVKGMTGALPAAFSNAFRSARAGYSLLERRTIGSLRRSGNRDQQSWQDPMMTSKSKLAKAYKYGTFNLAARRLGVFGDEFFSTLWYHGALRAQAYQRGKADGLSGDALLSYVDAQAKNPSKAAKESAGELAAEMTARTEQDPDSILSKINSARNADSPAGLAATIVVPFFNTLVNLTKIGWAYSPIGATAMTGIRTAQLLTKLARGEDVGKAKEEFGKAVARLVVSGAIFGAVQAAGDDVVRGSGASFDEDSKEYARERRAGQSTAINIGDMSIDLRPLMPVALPITQAADIRELAKGNITFMEFAGRQLRATIGEQFFQGVSDMAGIMLSENTESAVQRAGINVASGFVPGRGIHRDIDRFVSGERKSAKRLESESPGSRQPAIRAMRDILRTGIPLLADQVFDPREPARDLYGRTSSSYPMISRRKAIEWDAWLEKADTLGEQLRREAEANRNFAELETLKRISEPSIGEATVHKRPMTEEEFSQATKRAGELFLERLASSGLDPATLDVSPVSLKRVSAIYRGAWASAKNEIPR